MCVWRRVTGCVWPWLHIFVYNIFVATCVTREAKWDRGLS